jgi:hypothetical protein
MKLRTNNDTALNLKLIRHFLSPCTLNMSYRKAADSATWSVDFGADWVSLVGNLVEGSRALVTILRW